MPRLQPRARLLASLALFFAWTGTGRADPYPVVGMLTGTATLQADGSYLYQYTLTNPTPNNVALQWLEIQYAGALPTNPTSTGGWTTSPSPDRGYFMWVKEDGQFPGTTATFSFTSSVGPGTARYSIYGTTLTPIVIGYNTGSWVGRFGDIVGPVAAPEPASVVLLATAGGFLLLRLRRRPTGKGGADQC
jgi:hypothetical protein